MGERGRGVTLALAFVALSALLVSFISSSKAKGIEQQIEALKADKEKLGQTRETLERSLREARERYAQETLVTQNLKNALAQEQLKNRALADELQRRQQQHQQQVQQLQQQNKVAHQDAEANKVASAEKSR